MEDHASHKQLLSGISQKGHPENCRRIPAKTPTLGRYYCKVAAMKP